MEHETQRYDEQPYDEDFFVWEMNQYEWAKKWRRRSIPRLSNILKHKFIPGKPTIETPKYAHIVGLNLDGTIEFDSDCTDPSRVILVAATLDSKQKNRCERVVFDPISSTYQVLDGDGCGPFFLSHNLQWQLTTSDLTIINQFLRSHFEESLAD